MITLVGIAFDFLVNIPCWLNDQIGVMAEMIVAPPSDKTWLPSTSLFHNHQYFLNNELQNQVNCVILLLLLPSSLRCILLYGAAMIAKSTPFSLINSAIYKCVMINCPSWFDVSWVVAASILFEVYEELQLLHGVATMAECTVFSLMKSVIYKCKYYTIACINIIWQFVL